MLQLSKNKILLLAIFPYLFCENKNSQIENKYKILERSPDSQILIVYKDLELIEYPYKSSRAVDRLKRGEKVKQLSYLRVSSINKIGGKEMENKDSYRELESDRKIKGFFIHYISEKDKLDDSLAVCIDEKDQCKKNVEQSLDFHEFKQSLTEAYYRDKSSMYLRIRTDESASEELNPIVFIVEHHNTEKKESDKDGVMHFKTINFKKTKAHTFQFKTAERFLEMEAEKQSPQKYRIHILKYEGPEPEEFKNALNGFKVEQGY